MSGSICAFRWKALFAIIFAILLTATPSQAQCPCDPEDLIGLCPCKVECLGDCEPTPPSTSTPATLSITSTDVDCNSITINWEATEPSASGPSSQEFTSCPECPSTFGISVAVADFFGAKVALIGEANNGPDYNGLVSLYADFGGSGENAGYEFMGYLVYDGDISYTDFGLSVAVSNGIAAVGASGLLYLSTVGSGDAQDQFVYPAESPDSSFGQYISMSDDAAFIIASCVECTNGDGVAGGVAVVYERTDAFTWNWVHNLGGGQTGDDATQPGDQFGRNCISADSSTVFVMSPTQDYGKLYKKNEAGSGYVYVKKISGQSGSRFGIACALTQDGSYLYVGAPLHVKADDDEVGAVYVIDIEGDWTDYIYSQQSFFTNFGGSVSISADGTYVAVGADQDESGESLGATFIYKDMQLVHTILPSTELQSPESASFATKSNANEADANELPWFRAQWAKYSNANAKFASASSKHAKMASSEFVPQRDVARGLGRAVGMFANGAEVISTDTIRKSARADFTNGDGVAMPSGGDVLNCGEQQCVGSDMGGAIAVDPVSGLTVVASINSEALQTVSYSGNLMTTSNLDTSSLNATGGAISSLSLSYGDANILAVGTDNGAVLIYERDGSSFGFSDFIPHNSPSFGEEVAVMHPEEGTYLLAVSVTGDYGIECSNECDNYGSVFIYRRQTVQACESHDGMSVKTDCSSKKYETQSSSSSPPSSFHTESYEWAFVQTIQPTADLSQNSKFGSVMCSSEDGNLLVVGAPAESRVWAYLYNSGSSEYQYAAELTDMLMSVSSVAGSGYGSACSIGYDDEVFVVAAPNHIAGPSVVVFTPGGNATLTSPSEKYSNFGRAISVNHGQTRPAIVVSADYEAGGAVFTFAANSGGGPTTWSLIATLDIEGEASFGSALQAVTDFALIGDSSRNRIVRRAFVADPVEVEQPDPIAGFDISCSGEAGTFCESGLSASTRTWTSETPAGWTGTCTVSISNYDVSDDTTFDSAEFAPSAPTKLQTPASRYLSLFYSWSAPESVPSELTTSYVLTVKPSGSVALPPMTVTSTSALANNLKNGVSYLATIKATNKCGSSSSVAFAPATPRLLQPLPPTDVKLTIGCGTVKIDWKPSTELRGFNFVKYGIKCTTGISATPTFTNVDTLTWTATSVPAGWNGKCFVSVTSDAPAGWNLAESAYAAAPAPVMGVPAKPTALSALQVGTDGVKLTWTAPTATGYAAVQYIINDGQADTTVSTSPYSYTSVAAGDYTYTVKTTNQCGVSSTASATIKIAAPAPTLTISGRLFRTATPTITGSASGSGVVTLRDENSNQVGSGPITDGQYSITLSAMSQGAHTLTSRVTDNGVTGSPSQPALIAVLLDNSAQGCSYLKYAPTTYTTLPSYTVFSKWEKKTAPTTDDDNVYRKMVAKARRVDIKTVGLVWLTCPSTKAVQEVTDAAYVPEVLCADNKTWSTDWSCVASDLQ